MVSPVWISTSYCSPVRLSVIAGGSLAVATPPPFSLWVCSSAMAPSLLVPVSRLPYPERYGQRARRAQVLAIVGQHSRAHVDAGALGRHGLGLGVGAAARR